MSDALSLEGVGLHSGRRSRVTLHRSDGPVRLIAGGRTVRPVLSEVASTNFCTTLGLNGVQIGTVEHLLAALHAHDVWAGLTVEVDGSELPILDGSAQPWAELVAELKTQAPFPPPPDAVGVTAKVTNDTGGFASVEPATETGKDAFEVSIAFDHPAIGHQAVEVRPDARLDVLPARTFGFLADAEKMLAAGYSKGASAESVILFNDMSAIAPLRFPDEPVRHKALDALGDLYLLGAPIAGRIRVHRGGHALHVALAAELNRKAGA